MKLINIDDDKCRKIQEKISEKFNGVIISRITRDPIFWINQLIWDHSPLVTTYTTGKFIGFCVHDRFSGDQIFFGYTYKGWIVRCGYLPYYSHQNYPSLKKAIEAHCEGVQQYINSWR